MPDAVQSRAVIGALLLLIGGVDRTGTIEAQQVLGGGRKRGPPRRWPRPGSGWLAGP